MILEQDRIELRRLANGKISARWYAAGRLADAAIVAEEQLVGQLHQWPRAPLMLHGRALVCAEMLWAAGFELRLATQG